MFSYLTNLNMWHFIQMVECSYGLCSEREENSQSEEGVSDKRLSMEKGGSTLLKENVCQVGVLMRAIVVS